MPLNMRSNFVLSGAQRSKLNDAILRLEILHFCFLCSTQLRKFADAQICETVVWPAKTVAERRQIGKQIVKQLMERYAKYIQHICTNR